MAGSQAHWSLAAMVALCCCSTSTSSPGGGDASIGPLGGGDAAIASLDGGGDAPTAAFDGGCSTDGGCAMGLTCCGGRCVNAFNDPHNCGDCGVVCTGATAYCEGQCIATPCDQEAGACGSNSCCGAQCCDRGQLCCLSGAGAPQAQCYSLRAGETTCPQGCVMCQ
jgi:hypothetical protein